VTYRLIRLRFPQWVAIAVTTCTALNAWFLELTNEIRDDVPFLFGMMLSLYGWERLRVAIAEESNNKRRLLAPVVILGVRAMGRVAAYSASKAGLMQLTRTLALTLARHDIRVNAIAPGYFATDLNRGFLASEAGKALVERIPLRRTGRHDELDGALLLLASEASGYMTGSIVTVDGGFSVGL